MRTTVMETDAPRPAPSSDGAPPFSGSLREGKDSPCVVRARSLCRNFREKNRNVTALSSLDVDISAGCMTALVGPDGAGKTCRTAADYCYVKFLHSKILHPLPHCCQQLSSSSIFLSASR